MNLKQQFQGIGRKVKKVFRSHQAFVVVLGLLLVLVAVVVRLNALGNLAPDTAYIDDQIRQVKIVKFNPEALEDIQALRASNVTIPGVDLPEGRQNPFSE